jgi:large subunit ribosomal protein L33
VVFFVSEKVILICEECLSRNYIKNKNKTSNNQERLKLKKFCPKCNKHTLHKETK